MERCKCCGFPTREGRQLCPVCDGTSPKPDAFLPDGTPLYLKTGSNHSDASLQLELYEMLAKYRREVDKED